MDEGPAVERVNRALQKAKDAKAKDATRLPTLDECESLVDEALGRSVMVFFGRVLLVLGSSISSPPGGSTGLFTISSHLLLLLLLLLSRVLLLFAI